VNAGLTPPAQAVGGCLGSTLFVESQAWWTPAPGTTGGNDFGHVHVAACIPERDVLTANTTIPVTVTLHHNPGKLADLSLVFKTANSEQTVYKAAPGIRTCPVDQTCATTVDVPIDIMKFDRAGLQEIRLRVYVDQPDGKRMHTSMNFQTYIENGKTRSNVSRQPYLRSKGWYTDYGYCEPDVLSVPLHDKPVSGLWNVKVQQVDHGSTDVDPTWHTVRIDANSHLGLPGTILADGPGPLPATTFAIDTTKLSNGVHRLVQRVDCTKGNQTNSGVSVIQFVVQNGAPQ
jgi:hypothetical protein